MINYDNLSFGQRIDPENNLVECWFTHGALDWIKKQDWSNLTVLMYGGGMGDVWLSKKCNELYVIERDLIWYFHNKDVNVKYGNCRNLFYYHRPCNDSSGMAEYYLEFPDKLEPDIIISDDAYRTEAVFKAVDYFKQKEGGGILICDNYDQDYVWDSPVAVNELKKYESLIFECSTHKDHNGKPWKTGIFFIK